MPSRILVALFAALGVALTAATATAAPPWVTITSSPPGATVYIDGKERGPQGMTAETFRVRLTPGGHQLLLELSGYKPLEQAVQIGPRAQRLSFALERAPARLSIRTPAASDDARDGELFVDGEPRGNVPRDVEVKEGSHLIEVRKPGFKVYSETVEVRPAEAKTVMITLKAEIRRGTLLVSAPSAGLVYIDGQARGAAPQVVELDEGDHGVEVRKSDGGEVLWQQRVKVVAGQQVPVQADFKVADKNGSLLIVAPDDAEIVIDGTQSARPNQVISGLRPGQHAIMVQGKGYVTTSKVVEIEANKQRVEQLTLEKTAAGRGMAMVRVVMVSPVEGAEYFVNGRAVKAEDLLGDKGVEIPAGENVVVVQRQGLGKFTRTIHVAAGGTEAVRVDLKSGGRIAVSSSPPGGQILIDGQPVGTTSVTTSDVPPGQHLVEIQLGGLPPFSQRVDVRAGEVTNVQADLQQGQGGPPMAVGPGGPPGQVPVVLVRTRYVRPEMSASLSAVTNDPGRFIVDVGGGYPYFASVGLSVGAARFGMFGLDTGVELRTNIYMTEVLVRLRSQLFHAGPMAGGLTLLIGGGGGPDGRNDFVMELGAPLTLIAGRVVQLTFKPYLQIYSDRVCPSRDNLTASSVTRSDGCSYAIEEVVNGRPDTFGALDRFTGARFLMQAALEISLSRNINLWFLFEGAPGTERLSFTSRYNLLMVQDKDYSVYGRAGVTFKF